MCRRACVTSGLLLRPLLAALLVSLVGRGLLDLLTVPRSDQVLFVGLALGVGSLWSRYRQAESPETKLRLAALTALLAVVLLSVTSTMPWMEVDAAVLRAAAPWNAAATAVGMGQTTVLALLLPALIWLLVEPRHLAAQAATAVGASVAGFTILAILLAVESIPSPLSATLYWTADLALLACSTIVVATVLIVRQSFALLARDNRLPRAYLRR